MRTSLCRNNQHASCGGQANRGTSDRPRLDPCSCSCHARPSARNSRTAPIAGTVRRWARERDGFRCRANAAVDCTGAPDHVHHILQRSAGGGDELGNLITVCAPCHDWIHSNITAAEERGLLARSGAR